MTFTYFFTEFTQVILAVDDYSVLFHHPINSKTFIASRILLIFRLIGIFSISLACLPAILGAWRFHLLSFPFCMVLWVSLIVTLSATFTIVAYFIIIRFFKKQALIRVMGIIEIVIITVYFVVIYFSEPLIKLLSHICPGQFAYYQSLIINVLNNLFLHNTLLTIGLLFALNVALSIGMFLTILLLCSKEYLTKISYLQDSCGGLKKKKQVNKAKVQERHWGISFLRTPEEKAGFFLVIKNLQHDNELRKKVIVKILPALFLIAALLVNIKHSSMMQKVLLSLPCCIWPIVIFEFYKTKWYKASWVIGKAPCVAFEKFFSGIQKSILFLCIIPFVLIINAFLLLFIDTTIIIQNCLICLVYNYLLLNLFVLFAEQMPFSQNPLSAEYNNFSQEIISMVLIILSISFTFTYNHFIWYFSIVILLLFASFIIRKKASQHFEFVRQEMFNQGFFETI